MKPTILVAGGTGDLGGRIIRELLARGATVKALIRPTSDKTKVEKLEQSGAEIITADPSSIAELTKACAGVSCVVSALAGLKDVIIDAQSTLLDAAVAAGVPRFIPSDFSTDFTQIAEGENRNFDLRREFMRRIDKADIAPTSVFNGGFAELLNYNIPLLDFKKKSVSYWENPDWKVDFTTMDNTAAFTAAIALDDSTPRFLHIASFQVSASELAELAGFELIRMGSLEELSAYNKRERAAHPEGEDQLYAKWQQSQYMHSMFSAHNDVLDNDRYPYIKWTSIKQLLTGRI